VRSSNPAKLAENAAAAGNVLHSCTCIPDTSEEV